MERNYDVKIVVKEGTCKNELFDKMAKNGDLISTKVYDLIGAVVKIIGYAKCDITTKDKKFITYIFDTEEYGLISTGSEIFYESVIDYIDEINNMRIVEIKTRNGKTYKAVPQLNQYNQNIEE